MTYAEAIRHAIPAGLIADAVGIIASLIICRMMFACGNKTRMV